MLVDVVDCQNDQKDYNIHESETKEERHVEINTLRWGYLRKLVSTPLETKWMPWAMDVVSPPGAESETDCFFRSCFLLRSNQNLTSILSFFM